MTDLNDLTKDMPIAKALLENDTESIAYIIAKSLPKSGAKVEDICIEKTVGEAFSGGRSTPIYRISCQVVRPNNNKRVRRHFVAKLVLMPGENEDNGNAKSLPDKLWVKRESYAVERRFYDCAAPKIRDYQPLVGSGLTIPKLLASDRDGSKPWPAVCFLMNDLSTTGFPSHPEFLSTSQTKAALRWLATFHGLFWEEASANKKSCTWTRDLWDRGGHWTAKYPAGKKTEDIKIAKTGQLFSQTVCWLESKHPEVVSLEIKGLGKRLEAAADPIADYLNVLSNGPLRTLIHGDYKAANMFLAGNGIDKEDQEGGGAGQVAVLDFQFAGIGVGAEDVAYLLFPDAKGNYFDTEEELLECYHEELICQLMAQSKGGPSSLPFRTFRALYALSQLDLLRHLLGRGWVGSTEGDAKLVSALEDTMNQIDGGNHLASKDQYSKAIAAFVGAS